MDRRFGFGKKLRVRKRREFLAVQRRGRSRHTPHFVVLSIPRADGGPSRAGVTVSRRVGNAVLRNRVKRRVREFFRLHRRDLPVARDFVCIAKSGAERLSYAEIARELRRGAGIGG
jgi:ribonuclease P protein component